MMFFDTPVVFESSDMCNRGAVVRHDLAAHVRSFPQPAATTPVLLADIETIGLTGRGGGHFPVAKKLAPLVTGGVDAVVINGSEGELLSAKDAALLQLRPHVVLDGAQALARAVRARRIVVWLHDGADASLASVRAALEERDASSAHTHECVVQILLGPARYLTGEASSVIAGVRGEPVLPKFISDPAKPWIDGEPVLVHNVETHARIGALSHVGAHGYETTSLVTLSVGSERRVVEVTPDVTFAELFAAQGVRPPRLLLLGGYGGTWYAWTRLADLQLDPVAMRAAGASFGTGIIAVPPRDRDELQWSAEILEWMAGESAGQCGPCIFGLPELAREYRQAVEARHFQQRRLRKVQETMALIEGRGACRHPDGAIRMARSALDVMAEVSNA